MKKFISCDWGTSALRVRLVDANNLTVLAEVMSAKGIYVTFDLWKQSRKKESERLFFYQSILTEQIRKMEELLDLSLQDIPLIISGMASSNIGMLEIPYKEVPISSDGNDLYIKISEATNDFKHGTLMISGVKTEDDAMRGEETQLIGCLNKNDKKDQLFIFPGTHSKHIVIKNEKVTGFKTYMTGEFFELLSKKSILSNNLEETKDLFDDNNLKNFEKGITDSLDSNILHSSFLVRTNHLFGKVSKQENYCYLSGVLVGSELKELINTRLPLTIVGEEKLIRLYSSALQKLSIPNVQYCDAGKAVINGHCKMYDLHISKLSSGQYFINKKKQTL